MISSEHRQRYLTHYAEHGRLAEKPSELNRIVTALCRLYGYDTVLDYGCGAAQQLAQFPPPNVTVQSYDPGVVGADSPPRCAALVVCNHMLEHVEDETSARAVLSELLRLTGKMLYLAISVEESTKVLPDGTPWHTFVRPADWWDRLVNKYMLVGHVERDDKQVVYIWKPDA